MATPFVSTLLPWDTYGDDSLGDVEGAGQATVGRTRFTFSLEVAEVTSVTVVIQGAAVDDDDEYTTLATFNSGAISATGSHTLTSPTDLTIQPYHEYLRAKVTAQTGDATLRVTMAGAFIDPTLAADTALLSKELREWSDGLTRIVEQAERDVRSLLLHRTYAHAGVLDINGDSAWAHDEVRAMVAEQAEHLFTRAKLHRSNTAEDAARLLDTPDKAPGLMDRARRLQRKEAAYWRGR